MRTAGTGGLNLQVLPARHVVLASNVDCKVLHNDLNEHGVGDQKEQHICPPLACRLAGCKDDC